jgi:hypothetical protein
MSQMLLTMIGVELPRLRDAIFRASTDDDVAAWLRTHASVSQYERANVVLTEWRHENIAQEHRAHFESLYPDYLLSRYPVGFDLLEADDRELYPTLGGKR